MNFSESLKRERLRLGLTQVQAASLLDVSKSIIEKWESKNRIPIKLTQEAALARLGKLKSKLS